MIPCIVRRYSASYSYGNSRAAYELLRTIPQESWTQEMVDEVEKGATENSQIVEGNLDGVPIPELTVNLLAPIKSRLASESPFDHADGDFVPVEIQIDPMESHPFDSGDFVTPSGDDEIPI